MTHSKRCILASVCTAADSATCTRMCPPYVAMHGLSGGGGRAGAAGVPAEYRLITLKTSPARSATAPGADGKPYRIYDVIETYAKTFGRQFDPDGPRVKSLYLYSAGPGTGKTTTAAALLNEWLIVHYVGSVQRGQTPAERPAVFLDVNAWQSDYNEFNRAKVPDHIAEPAATRYYSAQQAAMAAPFAVLDDIGVRDCSEAFRSDLHRLINARVTAGLPTVYTSNVPLAQLNDVFRESPARLVDRVRDMCVEVTFAGESKRGMR